MNPQEAQQTSPVKGPDDDTKQKKDKKKLKVIATGVAAVLVVGGVTAALVVRSIYNKPENVVATALGNYLLDGKDKNFDTKISMTMEEAVMGVKDVDLSANVQMSGKTTQIDMTMNASIITLRGSIQSNENGTLYVKIEDLPALLSSSALQSSGIPAEMATQLASLDGKWIEIKAEDMEKLTGQKAGESSFDKCTNALYAALDDDKLGDSVDKLYKQNKFLLAKSATEEKVGDRKLLKVEVGLDEAKFSAFAINLSKSDVAKKAIDSCGLSSNSGDQSTDDSELKDGKLTVWVDRGKKELVKLEATGDDYTKEGKKNMGMKMTMEAKKPAAKLAAPTDTVNILTLLTNLGIDPAMLQGLGATSGA